jgi:hypothetical protein
MTLVLNLPSELERELVREAAQLGLPLSDYAIQLLAAGREPRSLPRTGADLIDYWRNEGLIGTRPEIMDSPSHARALRQSAQSRSQP